MTINTRQKRLTLLLVICILVLSASASHDKESNKSIALTKDGESRNEEATTEAVNEGGILASTSEITETTPQVRQDVNSAHQASNDIDQIEDFPFLRDTNPERQLETDRTDDFQQVFESDHVCAFCDPYPSSRLHLTEEIHICPKSEANLMFAREMVHSIEQHRNYRSTRTDSCRCTYGKRRRYKELENQECSTHQPCQTALETKFPVPTQHSILRV